jgi:hypothetical protein
MLSHGKAYGSRRKCGAGTLEECLDAYSASTCSPGNLHARQRMERIKLISYIVRFR